MKLRFTSVPFYGVIIVLATLAVLAGRFLMPHGTVPLPCPDNVFRASCVGFHQFYAWVFLNLLPMLFVFLLKQKDRFWRAAFFSGLTLFLVIGAYNATYTELGLDIRLEGFRAFYTLFTLWVFTIPILLLSLWLYPESCRRIWRSYAAVTIAVALLMGLLGRGSVFQWTPLVGGLHAVLSFQALLASRIVVVWFNLFLILLIAIFSVALVGWIRTGAFPTATLKYMLKKTGLVYLLTLIPLLSLIPGYPIAQMDFANAKAFVAPMLPKLEEYKKAKKEYPQSLVPDVIAREVVPPYLLRRFEFMVRPYFGGVSGGYYLSRPEKYCFIIQDIRPKAGYWSLTSERQDWKFFPYDGRSLETFFWEVCEEPTPVDEMFKQEMGIDPNDPNADSATPPPGWQPSGRLIQYLQKHGG